MSDWKQEARARGIRLRAAEISELERFVLHVWEKGVPLGLSGRKNIAEIYEKDVLDSLILLHLAEGSKNILEIGSGAGFPAIPLKIILGAIPFVLVESKRKAVQFLEGVVGDLGLKDVKVVWKRAEELANSPEFKGKFDLILGRAVAPTAEFFGWAAPFVQAGGRIVLQKGARWDEELSQATSFFDKGGFSVEEVLPGLEGAKKNIVLRKCFT